MAVAGELAAVELAGLRVVNALGSGPESLLIELNGRPWSPQGMMPAEVSSLRRLEAGVCRLRFSREGADSLDFRLPLRPGSRTTLVAHSVWLAEQRRWGMAVFKLEGQVIPSARSVVFVHLGDAPRQLLDIRQSGRSWSRLSLKRREPERVPIVQSRGYLPIRAGELRLASLPVFESGEHVVILFSDEKGGIRSTTYRERPQSLVPPGLR